MFMNPSVSSPKVGMPKISLAILVIIAVVQLPPFFVLATEVPPTIDIQTLFTFPSALPKVEQNSGALTERIALEIPPGRNGSTPDLALEYNSQQLTDNIVGYGWSLDSVYRTTEQDRI